MSVAGYLKQRRLLVADTFCCSITASLPSVFMPPGAAMALCSAFTVMKRQKTPIAFWAGKT